MIVVYKATPTWSPSCWCIILSNALQFYRRCKLSKVSFKAEPHYGCNSLVVRVFKSKLLIKNYLMSYLLPSYICGWFDSKWAEQNVIHIFFLEKKRSNDGEIFNIAKVGFSGINDKSREDYKNQTGMWNPYRLRRKWSRPRVFFHITCSPNIKGDNNSSCIAVAAIHRLIWRSHPLPVATVHHPALNTIQKHNPIETLILLHAEMLQRQNIFLH